MPSQISAATVLLLLAAVPLGAQSAPVADAGARVDSIFSRFAGPASPGCAVGVTREGEPVLVRAYGMADLEHDVPNAPGTIFEAGSVSKQFTAAAVVLLAEEGRLSLDDDVRKHVPEVPDYGTTITLRHLLNHTSGLRDWGSVAAVGGWPRGSRVHTHAHVLDIVGRQTALNHPPGEDYSYTNTGYNLLAEIVGRVSGMPFAQFTRERIFEPLGMHDTQWRDDHTRIVKRRAVGYDPSGPNTFRINMPFENVHGNGGLLTTVGDLLTWTEALHAGTLGEGFRREMHRRGRLNDGREIEYASGLAVGTDRGLVVVNHGGATAGYRAFLTRYPERRVAVALLCNAGNAVSGALSAGVVDLYVDRPDAPVVQDVPAAAALPAEALAARAGMYRETRTHGGQRLVVSEGKLRVENGPELVPLSETRFRVGPRIVEFDPPAAGAGRAGFLLMDDAGDALRFEPVGDFAPTADELAEFAGSYRSEEAEVTYTVAADGRRLLIRGRVGDEIPLAPMYPDAFTGPRIGTIRFVRDAAGRVTEMRASSARVWDLAFQRQ